MTSLPARALIALPAAVLALALAPAATASAHGAGGGRTLLDAAFVPSVPSDPAILGVRAGAAPWVLDEGEVHVRADGRIRVELEGLQIPRPDGTRDNPIAAVVASVFCDGTLAARTAPQPMTVPGGDAEFRAVLALPARCPGATVLISPAANTAVYIASATARADED
jgi:hypothetical protein